MNIKVPPPPIQDWNDMPFTWQEWFRQVMVSVQDLQKRVTALGG